MPQSIVKLQKTGIPFPTPEQRRKAHEDCSIDEKLNPYLTGEDLSSREVPWEVMIEPEPVAV